MATPDDIERRVEANDGPRTARRSAAAQQIGELAQRRAVIAEQLADIERELGDVLVASSDVIDVIELARFTDIPAADLTRWLDGQRTTRTKRKKSAAGASTGTADMSRKRPAARTSAVDHASRSPEPAPRADVGVPRVTASVT